MENLRALAVLGAAALLLVALLQHFLTVKRDAREPPYLFPKVPIVGHLVGMMTQGSDYFHKLEARHHQSLYTLPILKGRMYLASSPEWAQAIHKSHKSIHFNTLVAQAMKSLFLMDEDAMTIINQNLNNEDGSKQGLMVEVHDMMFATLALGPDLDDLNKSILNRILPDVNSLAKAGPTKTKLWYWLRHHFSLASTGAIWGLRNPFLVYPDVEPSFWEFEANAMPLTMMPFPQIVARKGYKARQRVLTTYEEYAKNEAYNDKETSQLIKNRVKLIKEKYGFSEKMYAWGEASMLFGALLNTIPAAFWLISWIFEDENLVRDILAEVESCITISQSDSNKRTINATNLRSSCPLFVSTFRETLRLTGAVNVNRYVAEDTTVTNASTGETYLLKKDSVVQIASNVIHNRSLWGEDAAFFNPRRFMATGEKARSEVGSGRPQDPAAPFRRQDGKIYSSAFRSFGGGNNICPGRHFAQTEILGLVSLFVAGFEIRNAHGGPYKMPPYEDFKLSLGVVKPARDVDVIISRRKGYEDVEWAFEM